jgi:TRAP-type C4-dicarboxylate transport system permease small subunit
MMPSLFHILKKGIFMREGFHRIGDILASMEKFFIIAVMAMLTIVVVIHIGTRNLGYYVSWSYDVSMLLFAWLVFIGAALAVRDGSHYLIDVWNKSLLLFRRGIIVFAAFVTGVFIIILIWQGFKMSWLVRGRISGAGEIGMVYYMISLPVSAILSLFHLIESVLLEWKTAGKEHP